MPIGQNFATNTGLAISLVILRTLQWGSAVIVLGITSAFINAGPIVLVDTYSEVIVRLPDRKTLIWC